MIPTFKITQQEMEDLNDDCSNAISYCPQSRYDDLNQEYRDNLLRGNLDPLKLMSHWYKHNTLFKYGYSDYLDEDSLEIFDRYEEYLISLRRYNRMFTL